MKKTIALKRAHRSARIKRIRVRLSGTAERPRAAVHRSLRHISVQLIDDVHGTTLASARDTEISGNKTKTEIARAVGTLVAERALQAKIKTVVFDRRGNAYHGRVQAVADGMREKGLIL